jgi:hypothetical protein
MKRVTNHIKTLASLIIDEGMNRETDSLLTIVNFEWEIYSNRPFTSEDIYLARAWVYKKLGLVS